MKTGNYVQVVVRTESGCSVADGEYTMHIASFIGALDIYSPGGTDDVSLIASCIEDHIAKWDLPEEGGATVLLRESGEQEDVFWHKYYVVESMQPFTL